MRLNHLDLPTSDLAATRDILVRHFGFTCVAERGKDNLAILSGAGGMMLVLSRRRREGAQDYPDGFHIGFHLESPEEVEALHARLSDAGHPAGPAPMMQRGALGFYFTAPGGILIEIAHRPEH